MAKALTFNPLSDPSTLNEIVLNAITFAARAQISKAWFDNTNSHVRLLESGFGNTLALELKGIIYGSKTKTEGILHVPDGKVSMLKLSLFPKWMLRRFPPKMKAVVQTTNIYNSYPGIPVKDNVLRLRQSKLDHMKGG